MVQLGRENRSSVYKMTKAKVGIAAIIVLICFLLRAINDAIEYCMPCDMWFDRYSLPIPRILEIIPLTAMLPLFIAIKTTPIQHQSLQPLIDENNV